MLAEERPPAPEAPHDNVICLGLPRLPRERWNDCSHDLRNLPEGVVPLRDPGPTLDEIMKAALSPEMEAIHALIEALDRRTASGRRSRTQVRDLVYQNLEKARRDDGRFAKSTKAIERLVTMKWWERRPC